jgi:Rod binding domain-containing protein
MTISPQPIGALAPGAAVGLQGATNGLQGAGQAPAWVRSAGPDAQKEYAVGQAFEQMLVSTLAASLVPSGQGEGENEASGQTGAGAGTSGDASQNLISSMVPQALAGAIATGKGLGIAEQLTRELVSMTPGPGAGGATGGTRA